MRILNHWVSCSLATATLVAGLALSASAQQAGLVNVNIENVVDDIAIDINVEENDIVDVIADLVVQAPIGVAANVCNVSAAVLAQQAADAAPCDAQTTSTALNRIVQRHLEQ